MGVAGRLGVPREEVGREQEDRASDRVGETAMGCDPDIGG